MHKSPEAIPVDFVKSSNIEAIGYDHKSRTLVVVFKNKTSYSYHPITQAGFEALRTAESVGKYFNEHIKNNQNVSFIKIP